MEQTIRTPIELRVHNLENKYDILSCDIQEIKRAVNKIYLLGWGCFITVLGMLTEIIVK